MNLIRGFFASLYFNLYPCHLGSSSVQLGFKEITQDGAHPKHEGKCHHKHPAAHRDPVVGHARVSYGSPFGGVMPPGSSLFHTQSA